MITVHHQCKANVYKVEYLQSVEVTELWFSSPTVGNKEAELWKQASSTDEHLSPLFWKQSSS